MRRMQRPVVVRSFHREPDTTRHARTPLTPARQHDGRAAEPAGHRLHWRLMQATTYGSGCDFLSNERRLRGDDEFTLWTRDRRHDGACRHHHHQQQAGVDSVANAQPPHLTSSSVTRRIRAALMYDDETRPARRLFTRDQWHRER